MTEWQAPSMPSTGWFAADPHRFPDVVDDDDLGRMAYGTFVSAECSLPAPDAGRRTAVSLEPSDRRRLELHAALTTAGVAPLPGDLAAIDALCALDDTTHSALQRWLAHTL
ncbi:hypothetical protein ACWGJT_36160 [Streptomyces xantholiticus]